VKVRKSITKHQKVSRMDRKKWDVEKLNSDPGNQNRKEYQQTLQLNTNGQTVRKVTHQLRRTTASIPMA